MIRRMLSVAVAGVMISAFNAFAHDHDHDGGHGHHHDNGPKCATIFQGPHFSGMHEAVEIGAQIADLNEHHMAHSCHNDWNNRISGVVVEPGCTLTAYQYENFDISYRSGRQLGGQIRILKNEREHHRRYIDLSNSGINNMISSLSCVCGDGA